MTIIERTALYKKLEERRKRPLICYVTSNRPGAIGQMAGDAIAELLDQLETLPKEAKKADLLVVSNGGDPTVAWRAISLLRERVDEVAVLVPQAAFSAATLLAMGANEIVIHPNGNLGPVDPQITVTKPGEPERRFGFEELSSFLEYTKKDVGLTEQEHLRPMFDLFCKEVGTVPVGVAARSSLLSLSMGEKLLRMHMTGEERSQRARGIAEALNKRYFHHGYPVGRREAKEIGLPVADRDPEVEKLIWEIWLNIEKDLKVRQPFSPISEFVSSQQAHKLLQVPQSKQPLNASPSVVSQVIANFNLKADANSNVVRDFARAAAEAGTVPVDAIDFEIVLAVMESPRLASRHVIQGKIMACRLQDLNLQVNLLPSRQGWESVPIA